MGHTIHTVMHRCGKDDQWRATAYRQRLAISALRTTKRLSGQLVDLIRHPRFIVGRRFNPKTALPEANSFRCGCQQFSGIRLRVGCEGGFVTQIWRSTRFRVGLLRLARFDQEKARQYPQTVARK